MDMMCNFLPGDPRLVEQIVKELKSQGIFDQFRKECISDVDTKPAYQNLRQRVEGSVFSFLKEQTWNPDMNKNQVREMLRKHIHESGFLETGVERIVDQVVNPKINSVFLPKVDDVMYKYLGIERPKEEASISPEIIAVHDLLPKDLEAISPEVPEEKDFPKEETNDAKMIETSSNSDVTNEKMMIEENSIDSQSSVLSGIVSHDSNNSLKQDSVMSLNSSESRMSPSENNLKIELEDTISSHRSSDSNSKTELLSDEKMNNGNNFDNKEENINSTVEISEKSSEESKSRDKRREKYHSSSDKSKSRSDKERDKSRSEKHKKEEKDGKTEEKKYKIPKISDKNKDHKSKDKEDKFKSDKGKCEKDSRTDKDKKYDKDRKSKHSEKESSNSDRSRREKSEKDDKRDKKESSKSEKSRDDKRSSSSKKRDSNSSKDNRKEKDKESSTKNNKEETPDRSKNGHSSSSSRKDSKSKKDEDKSKSSHKKDDKNDKEDRKRKRRSRDDHYSSKEKRSGGRSSDRDSDGPSSSKKLHASPQTTSSDCLTQQTNQDSSGLNSEGSSGYSGNSDKAEDKHEGVSSNAQIEMQKIKLPNYAENLHEAMKIMKIRKLLKKLDGIVKTNPIDPEIQHLMKEIEELTKDIKRDKKENEKTTVENEETDGNQKTETSSSAPINIDEFISSSNISMAKWTALEAKFMGQITDVDYNSYESPYIYDEETSPVKQCTVLSTDKFQEDSSTTKTEEVIIAAATVQIETVNENSAELGEENYNEESTINGNLHEDSTKIEENFVEDIEELSISNHSMGHIYEQTTVLGSTNSQEININISDSKEVNIPSRVDNLIAENFKDFKQRAIVLLHKHAQTEEMIKIKNKDNLDGGENDSIMENTEKSLNIFEIEKENIGVNTRKDELEASVENSEISENNEKFYNKSINNIVRAIPEETVNESRDFQETLSKELTENNLTVEESITQDIDIHGLQNSCEVCLDSKGDICKGLEPSDNLTPLNFLQCIIKILENEISNSKETIKDYDIMKHDPFEHQTRKRKVNEKKTDISNNNLDTSATKRHEVDMKMNPKNLSPSSKKIHPHTNTKMRTDFSHTTQNKNIEKMNVDNQISEMKNTRQGSGRSESTKRTPNEVNRKTLNKSVDGSSEKKNRNQRYSSEDLYKPRMFLRRSGRESKNP